MESGVTFESAGVTLSRFLGHLNSFCVSVELGARPLHKPTEFSEAPNMHKVDSIRVVHDPMSSDVLCTLHTYLTQRPKVGICIGICRLTTCFHHFKSVSVSLEFLSQHPHHMTLPTPSSHDPSVSSTAVKL